MLTPASDVFQLAYIAYAALAQRKPFIGENDFATMVAIRDAVPPPSPETMIPGLAELILANLARLPQDREPTVASFADKLRALVHVPDERVYAKVAALRPDAKPAPHQSSAITGYRCSKTWDELRPLAADGVRHCSTCDSEVVQVRSLGALIPLLGRRCVAYDPGDESGD